MSGIRYTEEFKRDVVAQITDRGYSVREVADRLGISTKSLYDWKSTYHKPEPERQKDAMQDSEIRRLKAELMRVTEERGLLRQGKSMRFTLIDAREAGLSVERACQLCEVSPSGYYAWQGRPASKHQRDDMIYLAHIGC